MASSTGSCTTETTAVSQARPGRQDDSNSSEPSPRPNAATRTLLSPLDGSLALWGAGRRERIAELEVQLRQHDAQQPTATAEETLSEGSTVCYHEAGQKRRPGTEGGAAGGGGGRGGGGARGGRGREGGGGGRGRGGTGQDQKVAADGESAATGSSSNGGCSRSGNNPGGSSGGDSGGGGRGRGTTAAAPRPGYLLETVGAASTLEERLRLWDNGWRPPRLRELPRGGEGFFSGWTHLGQPERFELVKSVNRSRGSDGGALTDAELEWAVLCLEEVEEHMSALEFSNAAGILENVLGRCPGLTLAYYRLALCLLAARGASASRQAKRLLDCAMSLEEGNPHLRASVDLIMRMLRNDAIPDACWSDDNPKSLGDLRALEAAVDQF